MQDSSSFAIICAHCASVSIAADHLESAPSTAVIKCGNCGEPRGTLGGLRRLASSNHVATFASKT
jgi:hypothetical protein